MIWLWSVLMFPQSIFPVSVFAPSIFPKTGVTRDFDPRTPFGPRDGSGVAIAYASAVTTVDVDNMNWANTSNALGTANGTFSTVTFVGAPNTLSDKLILTFPDLGLPPNTVATAITFTLRCKADNLQAGTIIQIVQGGAIQTAVQAGGGLDVWSTGAAGDVVYGGDLWGLQWSPANFASGFGISVAIFTGGTAYVDACRVDVAYQNVPGAAGGGRASRGRSRGG